MELKHQVLKILEENRGKSLSGSSLAKQLFVTRSSVWKAVKSLQNDGYNITAVTNRGYCLLPDNDIVSVESITPYLRGNAANFVLDVRQSVTSTNTLAKELASKGAMEGTVIIAKEQTAGKGRMGRVFYSPDSTGIYFSIILRPQLSLENSLLITTCAAVAVSQAIETVAKVKAEIKWVNDIFVNGRKAVGILTEASLNCENGGLEYAVCGIGINVNTKTFPGETASVAGSVFHEKPANQPVTSMLVAETLNKFSECMASLTEKKYLEEYRKRSFLIGQDILVLRGSETIPAKAVAIDDKARLVVEYEDKHTEPLSSGEVSVRQRK